MGPEYWKPGSPTQLKKCSERRSSDCDPTETDGCCAVIPCAYCLEWTPDGGSTSYGTADFATSSWTGSIAGSTWAGAWQRNYDTDECEFVVTLDGVEVYRKSCYEGQSCRDSSDSVTTTIDAVSGLLEWIKYEARPLEYITDPDTNCTTYFCGDCECSCDCLCVTIRPVGETFIDGEICDTSYQCDGPVWEGTVGGYELSLALGRDQYGECIITATVDGIEQPPVSVTGCSDMEATITLPDETVIEVRCKKCSCDEPSLCCGGRDLAGDLTLTLVYPGTSSMVDCGDTVLTLTKDGDIWKTNGTVLIEVPDAGGEACVPMTAYFEFYCDPAGPVYEMRWRVVYLGEEYPTEGLGSDPDEDGKRWCGLIRVSEDCDCPFLEVWQENEACMKFWNSFFTFMVEEPPEACA